MTGSEFTNRMKTLAGYRIAPNEALNVGAVNRVVEHLLKNDDILRTKLQEAHIAREIVMWRKNCTYNPGDVVCYVTATTTGEKRAYILFCKAETHLEPNAVLRNDLKTLDDMGWKLIHETTLYLNDPDLLKKDILTPAIEEAMALHEQDNPHLGVQINDTSDFAKLFLKSDLSNFRSPKTVGKTFGAGSRLASSYDKDSQTYMTYGSEGVVELELSFAFDTEANKVLEILNDRYYWEGNTVNDKSDSYIFSAFQAESLKDLSLTNGLKYTNLRMPGTNIFSAVINFPVTFTDTTYTVFQSSYLVDQFVFGSSISDLTRRTAGNNAVFVGNILFTNKKPDSITAILPIHCHFTQYGQYSVGVPWINQFRLTVVGVVDK